MSRQAEKKNREPKENVRLNKVDFRKREVYVTFDTKEFQIFVDPDQDIRSQCKEPIANFLKIPIDEIHIFYRGKQTGTEFDDSHSLRYYGLQGGGFFFMTQGPPTSCCSDDDLDHASSSFGHNNNNNNMDGGRRQRSSASSNQARNKSAPPPKRVPAGPSIASMLSTSSNHSAGFAHDKERQWAREEQDAWQQDADNASAARKAFQAKKAARKNRHHHQQNDDDNNNDNNNNNNNNHKDQQKEDQKRQQKEQAAQKAAKEKRERELEEAQEDARKAAAEERQRREQEEAERQRQEEEARRAAEEKQRRQQQAEEKARREAEEKARREAEEKARQIPITVNTFTGQQIKMIVDIDDNVADIQRRLQQESGIPVHNQKLSMTGSGSGSGRGGRRQEIDNPHKTVREYGIAPGSVLDLDPQSITVSVKTPQGNTMKLQVSPSDTTNTIKEKIAKETGMTVPQQVLKFINGKELPNGKTAKDAGVVDGSELEVEIWKIPITVNMGKNGKKIKLMVDPTDSVSGLKSKLQTESGIPVENQDLLMNGMELNNPNKSLADCGIQAGSTLDLAPKVINIKVTTPDGNNITVQVKKSDTAKSIKEKIVKETGIDAPQQILNFSGKEMSNFKTVKDMGIQEGSELTVDVAKIPVTVATFDRKKIKVMVDPTDSIAAIKQQLERESGVPANNQKLSMGGQDFSDSNKSAADYSIKAGSVINLEPKAITVNVQTPDGKTIAVQVDPSDRVEAIKEKVAREAGIKAAEQILKFDGKEVPNNATIKDHGIKDGSNLMVEIAKVPVTVNTFDGKKIKVMVDPTDSIATVKKQLERESGVPAKNQKLSMGGHELGDPSKSAADYGVKAGSVINLEPKAITVNVRTPDGITIAVQVDPSASVEALKEKVAREAGIKAAEQILKFDGKEVPNNATIKDHGIKDGSNLMVEMAKVPVTVNTFDGKKIKVMVNPSDSMANIKHQLEKESGLPVNNQLLSLRGQELSDDKKSAGGYGIRAGSVLELAPNVINIAVKTPDGSKIHYQVKATDTAKSIKEKIAKEAGIDVSQQILNFSGKEMSNFKTVKDMGIQEGSELTLDVAKVPVTVSTFDGKKIKVMVDPSDNIATIKQQLERESGVPAKNQKLSISGQELSNSSTPAADYGIKTGSVINLEPKAITVNVQTPDGKTIAVQVDPSDRVEAIKEKVVREAGIKAAEQILKFNGMEMPNKATIQDNGLNDGSCLIVEMAKVLVTVNTFDGKKIKVMVDPTDSIADIKKQLEKDSGLPSKNQKLSIEGQELIRPNETARDNGIKAGSVLDLDPKVINVIAKTSDGRKHTVEIEPSDTVHDIKTKVAKVAGVAASQQILKSRGQELPNGKTALQLAIRDGSELDVATLKAPVAISVENHQKNPLTASASPQDRIAELKRQREAAKAAATAQSEAQKNKPKQNRTPVQVDRKKKDVPKKELDTEKKRKCFMAYARLGQPSRDKMLQSVKKLGKDWGISEEDVLALPWIANGAMLPVTEMNQLFMHG